MVFSRSCTGCGGTGQQRPRACAACGGTGQDARAETVTVRIPAGVADGDRVRVAGKGNAGLRGGSPGDLYITVHVAPHATLRREGDDLHLMVPIAIHEAALGARIDVPTPDGGAGCACRRGRSRASASGCASAARRRRATDGAVIWSSRSG